MRRGNAYLTVYLTMCLAVLLPLCLTLIDEARRNGAAMEAVCAAEVGMQNIFAEYHRELLRQYNLFAIDSSYGTENSGRANTEAHLRDYLDKNLHTDVVFLSDYLYRDFFDLSTGEVEITGLSILTDGDGAVFRSMAIDAIRNDVGLNLLSDVQQWLETIEVNGLASADSAQGGENLDDVLDDYNGREVQISETETAFVSITNPVKEIEKKRRMGILRLVLESEEDLSKKGLDRTGLIESRMQQDAVNRGNMEQQDTDGVWNNILFREYLLKYMGNYREPKDSGALAYQIEYLIAGKEYDTDNLRSIAARLCAVREAANVLYLYTDKEKSMEITTAATIACGIFLFPELIPVMETAIRFGWAYAESLYDVKTLLAGGKIPLIKDKESWHCGLMSALKGEAEDGSEEEGKGLAYRDYLRVLLMMTDTDTVTVRAMNMIEADIRLTPGNECFRLDACYGGVEALMKINSGFGYQFEILRERFYWR